MIECIVQNELFKNYDTSIVMQIFNGCLLTCCTNLVPLDIKHAILQMLLDFCIEKNKVKEELELEMDLPGYLVLEIKESLLQQRKTCKKHRLCFSTGIPLVVVLLKRILSSSSPSLESSLRQDLVALLLTIVYDDDDVMMKNIGCGDLGDLLLSFKESQVCIIEQCIEHSISEKLSTLESAKTLRIHFPEILIMAVQLHCTWNKRFPVQLMGWNHWDLILRLSYR